MKGKRMPTSEELRAAIQAEIREIEEQLRVLGPLGTRLSELRDALRHLDENEAKLQHAQAVMESTTTKAERLIQKRKQPKAATSRGKKTKPVAKATKPERWYTNPLADRILRKIFTEPTLPLTLEAILYVVYGSGWTSETTFVLAGKTRAELPLSDDRALRMIKSTLGRTLRKILHIREGTVPTGMTVTSNLNQLADLTAKYPPEKIRYNCRAWGLTLGE